MSERTFTIALIAGNVAIWLGVFESVAGTASYRFRVACMAISAVNITVALGFMIATAWLLRRNRR